MCVLCLFLKIFICFLAFHRQLEKSFFLIFMILPLSSFSPLILKKAVSVFACLSPLHHHFENPVCPSVLNVTPARPPNIERHLQAPQKTLSWEYFTLCLMRLLWELSRWSEAGSGEPCRAAGRAASSEAASRRMDTASCGGPRVWWGGKWGLHH